MKKIVTTYGLIAGAIVSTILAFSINLMKREEGGHQGGWMWMMVGFASMLLAFIFIFIAIKNYRDNYLGGTISFGKAFMTGMWVALIGSLCYTITWVIIYKGFYPDFMEQMNNAQLAQLQKSGKSPAEIAAEVKDMEKMTAMYKTWPGLIGFTMMEIFPVGLLVALVSALILKRKHPKPSQTVQLAS